MICDESVPLHGKLPQTQPLTPGCQGPRKEPDLASMKRSPWQPSSCQLLPVSDAGPPHPPSWPPVPLWLPWTSGSTTEDLSLSICEMRILLITFLPPETVGGSNRIMAVHFHSNQGAVGTGTAGVLGPLTSSWSARSQLGSQTRACHAQGLWQAGQGGGSTRCAPRPEKALS